MPHLRVGIVGDVRPSTALLIGLILGRQRMDDVFVITRAEDHIPLNREALTLELIRADIPVVEAGMLARTHATAPDVSLREVLMLEKCAEEYIPPEREPLPRPPKSIRPKSSAPRHLVIRKGVPRSR